MDILGTPPAGTGDTGNRSGEVETMTASALCALRTNSNVIFPAPATGTS